MKFKHYTAIALLSVASFSCNNDENKDNKTQQHEVTSDSNVSFANAQSVSSIPQNATEFSIAGKLNEGAEQKIYLYHFADQNPSVLDSTVIDKDGNFELKGKGAGYQFYAIGSSPRKIKLLLLKSNENIKLEGNYNELHDAKVEGSEDSNILNEYAKKQKEFYTKMQELQAQLKPLGNDPNNPERQKLIAESEKLTQEYASYVTNFIDNNLSSPAIITAAQDLFDPNNQLEYLKKIEHTLSKTMPESLFLKNLSASIKQIEQQASAQQAPPQNGNLTPGMEAPEINLPSPTGKNIALSSLRGKVVLIDFWASWCKPCRMENPNVVKLYNQYKDKGFTIYSVSLDKGDKARWVNAIQQDGLIWPNHVSDLKGWQSSAVQLYGITGIPFTVLIDQEGKVIATSLRGAQLAQKLKEILG